MTEWAQRRLHPQAEVFSDGLGAFRAVVPLDHAHTVIDAGGGRQATEADGARWVNIVLSNLKRALDGTYHAFKFFKYAHRYLAEAAWRFAHPLVGTIAASGSWPWCRVCSSPSLAVRHGPSANYATFQCSLAEIWRKSGDGLCSDPGAQWQTMLSRLAPYG